jgi:glycosyltransferase involved in cell wall biosynthesis
MFSSTGGIEKMARIIGKALNESIKDLTIFSSHDEENPDNIYFPQGIFYPFKGNKARFMIEGIRKGRKSDLVLLSHINLLPVGYFIRLLSPKTRIVLLAHGIEIWGPLSRIKKMMLAKCSLIISVSRYTDTRIKEQLGAGIRTTVLNNCLDPYLKHDPVENKPAELLNRYNLSDKNFVLLTLTRLSSEEKYKGYDKVLESLQKLLPEFPGLRYLIIGKYDLEEKKRMDDLIDKMGLRHAVILTGFIPDEELALHYSLADLYIMPSMGEGFGLVFIEAMFFGLPVIAGNCDGSVDALLDGRLGTLVNPQNEKEITSAIEKIIHNKESYLPDQGLLMKNFSYEIYKEKLADTLLNLKN